MHTYSLLPVVLNLFDGAINTNVTTDAGLSDEMKVFYSKYLITLAEPNLVHDQFAQVVNIPANGGMEVEFRQYDSLPKALTPLQEGITPAGQKISMGVLRSVCHQYGAYVALSDILILTAIDNNLMQATKLLASQAGRTLDTVTREVINAGTYVMHGAADKAFRHNLVGGESEGNDLLNILGIRKAVRQLKVMNAPKMSDGGYAAIVHPDTAFDLMEDPRWINVKTYSDPEDIYRGEIGKIEGVRFVESTEAKVFHAEDLVIADGANPAVRNLTVSSWTADSKKLVVAEALTANQAAALAGRMIVCNDVVAEVASATAGSAGAAYLTLKEVPAVAPAQGNTVYPGEAGAKGRDVYSTLIMGADAYGVTSVEGGGLQHIVKQLGSAGTADPLNQRATCGWKAIKTAEILVDQYMIRLETCSTFAVGAN